jgi:lysophospholipase
VRIECSCYHQAFQPEPFYLTSALLNETRFHDRAGNSLLSNSANIHDWRNHRISGGRPDPRHELDSAGVPSEYTVPVRSTRPIVHPDGSSSSREISDSCYETPLPSLITPASSTDTKVRYVILEVPPRLQLYAIRHLTTVPVATDPRQQV